MTPWNPPSRHYRALVFLAGGMLLLLVLAAVLFPSRIENSGGVLLSCSLALAGVVAVVAATARMPVGWRALLRAVGTIWLVSFLFANIAGLQHLIFDRWFDETVIAFETRFTGIELSLWMQGITTPLLTEWMMLAYVFYIPLIPFTAWVAWRAGGERALYEYLFALLLANVFCDIGFVLFPVASQMYHDPQQYTVPLVGGPFTAMAEWVRSTQHYPGGSLPSPHLAAGTTMLLTLWRRNRRVAWICLPLVVSILPATVYGRYHYLSDGLVGIPVGILAVAIAVALRSAGAGEVPHERLSLFPSFRSKNWRTS